jgi:hypothetical protein
MFIDAFRPDPDDAVRYAPLGRDLGPKGLCCTNPMRDSSCESSVVAGANEQTHTPDLQDQELARL